MTVTQFWALLALVVILIAAIVAGAHAAEYPVARPRDEPITAAAPTFVGDTAAIECPAGTPSRALTIETLLAPDTGWLLHSSVTGDALPEFWAKMPPPPGRAEGTDGRGDDPAVARLAVWRRDLFPVGRLRDRAIRAGAVRAAALDAGPDRGVT